MLIAFDYDGVIVDSFDVLLAFARQVQADLQEGRPPVADDVQRLQNLTFKSLGKDIGMSEDTAALFAGRIFGLQKQKWSVDVFPGIIPIIHALSQIHTLVIVTSSDTKTVAGSLSRFGIRSAFSRIYGGEQGTSKAERIAKARAELSFSAEDTVMIGDAVSDIKQGKAAGAKTVAVTWGFQHRDLLIRESPDYLVESPDELLAILPDK